MFTCTKHNLSKSGIYRKLSQRTLENAIKQNLTSFLHKFSDIKSPKEVKIQVTKFFFVYLLKTIKANTSKILYASFQNTLY